MDQGSLVAEQIEAGAQVAAEFDKYLPLAAAFWLKDLELKRWHLYLASEQINDSTRYQAYGEVVRIFGGKARTWIDMFQVKVVGVNEPVVRSVLELQQHPGQVGIHLWLRRLGDLMIEDGYIYPLPVAATS
jgi:hypothetical protein